MTRDIPRTLLAGTMALALASCGSTRPPAGNASAENAAVVEEVIPAGQTETLVNASAPAPVVSRMPTAAAPTQFGAAGSAPVVSTMAPVTSGMPDPTTLPAAPAAPVAAPVADVAMAEAPPTAGPRREGLTSGQVCAAAVGMLFGRDPATMQVVSDAGGIARIKYRRADQTTWTNECRVTDRTVTWRAIGADGPGRWRTEDEITYSASPAGIAMTVNGDTRAFAR